MTDAPHPAPAPIPAGFAQTLRAAFSGRAYALTSGSIHRALIILAVPMMLELATQSLFAFVDALFVAQLGAAPLATIGLVEWLLTLVFALAMGLSFAAGALVAWHTGNGDRAAAAITVTHTLYVGAAMSLVISALGLYFAPDALRLLGADAEVVAIGSGYARITLAGNAGYLFLFVINAIFRGLGQPARALKALLLATAINAVLAPVLIFGGVGSALGLSGVGSALGLDGAAWATVIARGAGVLYQLALLFRGARDVMVIRRDAWRPRRDVLARLSFISFGGGLQVVIANSSLMIAVKLLSRFGTDALAGATLAMRVLYVILMPSFGIGNAAAALVGQNLGAGEPARASAAVWAAVRGNALFLGAAAIALWGLGPRVLAAMTESASVALHAAACLRIITYGFVFYAVGTVLTQAFNGAGDTFTPGLTHLCCYWILRLPLAYALAHFSPLGELGIYWAITFSECAVAFMAFAILRRRRFALTRSQPAEPRGQRRRRE